MERVSNGEVYYYFCKKDLKLCSTHDWYFGTDNERWSTRNYFTNINVAKACAAALYEQFREEISLIGLDEAHSLTEGTMERALVIIQEYFKKQ